jgi:hypothetical protein
LPRDEGFDPNEEIVLPPGYTPPGTPPGVDPGQLHPAQIPGVAFFQRAAPPAGEGEFYFRVSQKNLKEALVTTGLTTSHHPFDQVKITLFRDRLLLQTNSRTGCFAEVAVRLNEPSPSIAEQEKDQAAAFTFVHKVLAEVVNALPEEPAVIEFVFAAGEQTLRFQIPDPEDTTTVQKSFQLTCGSPSDFPDYRQRDQLLANPLFQGKIDPVILREAVRYCSLFPAEAEPRPTLQMLELRQGTLFGGTQHRMGRIESPALTGVDLRIPVKAIATTAQVLARFSRLDLYVYRTERFFLLTDGTMCFGFEQTNLAFPDVEPMYEYESTHCCLVPRKGLMRSLALLAAVNQDRDLLVQVTATGAHNAARLYLETRERGGKPCRDFLKVRRDFHPGKETSDPLPDWRFAVEARTLLRLVQHFEATANVHLEVFNDEALYIFDEEGGLTARSLLAFLSEASVRKLKEQKAQTAATGRRTALH